VSDTPENAAEAAEQPERPEELAQAEEPVAAEPAQAEEPAAAEPAPPRDLGPLKEILEALVFVHRGILPPKTAREVLGEEFTADEIAAGFASLREDYESRGGAIVLLEVAGGFQFGTRDDLATWIQKLDFYEHHRHLSRPTMETLAIIAYKQPVTRAEIEAIRGVNVERIVRNLLERKLVRILGHKDVPGKPMVLGTTKDFLQLFGLNSLADLPPLKDFVEPPSTEGIDEELPLPPAEGDAGVAEGAAAEQAAEEAIDEAAGREAGEDGHGFEREAGDREPDPADDGDEPVEQPDEAR
jgi:segregation and condensation protein B